MGGGGRRGDGVGGEVGGGSPSRQHFMISVFFSQKYM